MSRGAVVKERPHRNACNIWGAMERDSDRDESINGSSNSPVRFWSKPRVSSSSGRVLVVAYPMSNPVHFRANLECHSLHDYRVRVGLNTAVVMKAPRGKSIEARRFGATRHLNPNPEYGVLTRRP